MTRINITDEQGNATGFWFNPDASKFYLKEEKFWDGHNWISKATGSQFHHESIHYTKSGRFIKNEWSDYQGGKNMYFEISESEVVEWVIKNEFEDLDFLNNLPAKIKESVLAQIEEREV